MTIFIEPKSPANVVNCSFDKAMLSMTRGNFFIIFSYGIDSTAFEFFIDLEVSYLVQLSCVLILYFSNFSTPPLVEPLDI